MADEAATTPSVTVNYAAFYLPKGLTYLSGSGISPNGKSPKVSWIGAFENCNICSLATMLCSMKKCGLEEEISLEIFESIRWWYLPSRSASTWFKALVGECSGLLHEYLIDPGPLQTIKRYEMLRLRSQRVFDTYLAEETHGPRGFWQHCNKIIL